MSHSGVIVVGTGTTTPPYFTAALVKTLQGASAAGTGTTALPQYSGLVARMTGGATAAATGSTTPPQYTGTASVTIAGTTVAAAGTTSVPVYTATADVNSRATVAGDGTTTPPVFTAAADLTSAAVLFEGYAASSDNVFEGDVLANAPGVFGSGFAIVTQPVYTAEATVAVGPTTVTGRVKQRTIAAKMMSLIMYD
jgi:hypothetical protein